MAIKKANKMQHFFRLITKIPAKCRFNANIMHTYEAFLLYRLTMLRFAYFY